MNLKEKLLKQYKFTPADQKKVDKLNKELKVITQKGTESFSDYGRATDQLVWAQEKFQEARKQYKSEQELVKEGSRDIVWKKNDLLSKKTTTENIEKIPSKVIEGYTKLLETHHIQTPMGVMIKVDNKFKLSIYWSLLYLFENKTEAFDKIDGIELYSMDKDDYGYETDYICIDSSEESCGAGKKHWVESLMLSDKKQLTLDMLLHEFKNENLKEKLTKWLKDIYGEMDMVRANEGYKDHDVLVNYWKEDIGYRVYFKRKIGVE